MCYLAILTISIFHAVIMFGSILIVASYSLTSSIDCSRRIRTESTGHCDTCIHVSFRCLHWGYNSCNYLVFFWELSQLVRVLFIVSTSILFSPIYICFIAFVMAFYNILFSCSCGKCCLAFCQYGTNSFRSYVRSYILHVSKYAEHFPWIEMYRGE